MLLQMVGQRCYQGPAKMPKTNEVAENEEPPIIDEMPTQQSTPTPVETTNQQPRNKKNATHALHALKQKVKEQKAKKATHKRRKERETKRNNEKLSQITEEFGSEEKTLIHFEPTAVEEAGENKRNDIKSKLNKRRNRT